MRAASENPALLALTGFDPAVVARRTCLIGGGLAAVAGVFLGLTVQVRPLLGFELLLPLFAAVILGGIGSVYGALAGSLVVGLAEALSVPLVGAEYRAAVAFLVLLAVLLVRPAGIAGARE
jgi:branched-chain amino acid transport system permease protein